MFGFIKVNRMFSFVKTVLTGISIREEGSSFQEKSRQPEGICAMMAQENVGTLYLVRVEGIFISWEIASHRTKIPSSFVHLAESEC